MPSGASGRYRVAAGSAVEARGGLDLSVAFGDLEAAEIAEAWARLDRVVGLLWPLTK